MKGGGGIDGDSGRRKGVKENIRGRGGGGPAVRRNCQVGGVENNADLFYSASQRHDSKDSFLFFILISKTPKTVVYVKVDFICH
jgi:hypothetical protein